MDFGGDLRILEPTTIFQLFNMSRLTGMLKFEHENRVASFYFKDSRLIYTTINSTRKKIGELLIEQGQITQPQLEEALEVSKKNKGTKRIGQILIDRGFLDSKSLSNAIKEQMKEIVYKVLPWKEGKFVFISEIEPENEDIYLNLGLDHLILEGMRRIDEGAPMFQESGGA